MCELNSLQKCSNYKSNIIRTWYGIGACTTRAMHNEQYKYTMYTRVHVHMHIHVYTVHHCTPLYTRVDTNIM